MKLASVPLSIVALCAWSISGGPAHAAATSPLSFTQSQVKKLSSTLASKKKNRIQDLKLQVRKIFDFAGFAQESLGDKWKPLKSKDQKQFSEAVRSLIESIYLRRPDKIFGEHSVQIESESIQGDLAEVMGLVKQDDLDIEVVLKLKKKGSAWIIRDIVFDELSLLEDYQYQFGSYLNENPIKKLTKQLKDKAKENQKTKS